jgi:amino acid adenylation domain-containing protein/non-ribosomal peptide synthase protein (TIGR01720 family)
MIHASTIRGAVDEEAFAVAFQSLVDASDAMRTTIRIVDGVPQQQVQADMPSRLQIIDVSLESAPDEACRQWIDEQRRQALDLEQRLFASALIKVAADKYVWYLCQHHLISDAQSFALVFRILSARYSLAVEGRLDEAQRLESFAEYVSFEREYRDSPKSAKARDFWQSRVDESAAVPRIYGHAAGSGGNRTDRLTLDLGITRTKAIREIAASKGFASLSPAMSMASLWSMLVVVALHRITGERKLTIGTPFQARPNPKFKDTIGAFVEIGLVNAAVADDATFQSMYQQILRQTIEGLRYARPGISSAVINRAYPVLLNYLTAEFGDFGGLPVTTDWIHSGYGDSNHAIRIQVSDYDRTGSLLLHFDVNADIFDGQRRCWLMRQFEAVVDAFIDDPSRQVGSFDLTSREERSRWLVAYNATDANLGDAETILTLFEDQVRQAPEAAAAAEGLRTWSYAELDVRSRAVSSRLIESGIGRGDRVAICMPRSLEVLAALLGTLRAGAAFCPLDPSHPEARKRELLDDLQAAAVLVAGPDVIEDETVEGFEIIDVAALDSSIAEAATEVIRADDLAYLIYTSGSTGRPKAAMLSHGGLVNYLQWAARTYLEGTVCDFPLYSSLAFDLTITSLFLPLLTGGKVRIYNEREYTPGLEILSVFADDDVDIVKLTPSHLDLLRHHGTSCTRIRKLIVGGEEFKTALARSIVERLPGVAIYNEYGPTEATVGCMVHRFDPATDDGATVPIGVPAANTHILVIDDYGQPTPSGVTGEMVVSGPGVALGYWNRPALSREKFDIDPATGVRRYRTGDLARWASNGLEFLGRADDQVKVRGVRIELGEVEARLLAHPGVRAAAVSVHESALADNAERCRVCGLSANYPSADIDGTGICADCRDYGRFEREVDRYFRTPADLHRVFDDVKRRHSGGLYDCIALTSGGKDSTYMLYQLVRVYGLRPLVFTLDNGYLSERALANVRLACDDLGLDVEVGRTPHMAAIFADSLRRHCNVCHGCFKTIYTLSMTRAHELGIDTIVTGLSRGQLFETRLADTFRARQFDPEEIDALVKDARRVYHQVDDAVRDLLDTRIFDDSTVIDEIDFVDFYRYVDVELAEVYDYLDKATVWQRPEDTGRSTNCLINDVGIYIHKKQRGYHNYALPYSWDVRLGHKQRDAAVDELDDDIDEPRVRQILEEIGYDETGAGELSDQRHLVAYYVGEPGLTQASVRQFLSDYLPSAVIPTYLVSLDALPLTANGKLDRRALPAPTNPGGALDSSYVEATTALQKQLVSIWQNLMNVDRIGIDDNFFELGGDSVMSIQITAMVNALRWQMAPTQLFKFPTIRLLAEDLESGTETPTVLPASEPSILVKEQDREQLEILLGPVAPRLEDAYPLSPTQAGMLFQTLSAEQKGVYVGQARWTLSGRVDVERLCSAYEDLVIEHPVLRSRVLWNGLGEPMQVTGDWGPPDIVRLEWSGRSSAEIATGLKRLMHDTWRQGFDLERAPAVRLTVVVESAELTHLHWATHHMLLDGWSAQMLLAEWLERYEALAAGVDFHRPQGCAYRDFIAWVRSKDEQQSRQFWTRYLDGLDSGTKLPLGLRGASPSIVRREWDLRLSEEGSAALRQLASGTRVTLNSVFQGAWALLLSRYCDRPDVVFGATFSGRNGDLAGIDRAIGLLINTLPIRLNVDEEKGISEWLGEVQANLLAVSEFEHSSLAEVQAVSPLGPGGELFDSIVVFENYPVTPSHNRAGVVTGRARFETPSHYPLALLVFPDEQLRIQLVYDEARFTPAQVERLGLHLETLLIGMAADSAASIRDLSMLAPVEQPAPSGDAYSAPQSDASPCLHELVADSAAAAASAIAIRCGKEQLDYATLDAHADFIASKLIEMGVQRGDRVGLIASRTPLSIAGLLGILKAAAAFVPLDPKAPPARIAEIVADARIGTVLSDRPADVPCDCRLFELAELIADTHPSPRLPPARVDADELAYVLYTSGSTGRPKGVMVTHRNIVASTLARLNYYPGRVQSFLHVSPLAFDSAMAGLFWTLVDGGAVVFPEADDEQDPAYLLELMKRHRVTHVLALPRFYDALLEVADENGISSLRIAIVAGEACPPDLFARHRVKTVACTLYNEYGPTEATVWSHVFRFPDDFDARRVPIGDPIGQMRHFVVDRRLRPVPVGVPGELLLAGPGLAKGYLGQEALTRERFLQLPGEGGLPAGLRCYRTGDRVRIREDGGLDFLGRVDHQLKIRGFRVEPQEIEIALTGHPAILAAAVVETPDEPGVRRLIVGVYEALESLASDALRRLVSDALPDYMVPDRFQRMDSLPRLSNGKIDRSQLSQVLKFETDAASEYHPPQSSLEAQLAEIWATVLKVERVGRNDNFLDLGGDSILALQVVSRARRYGIRARPRDALGARSLAAFAEICTETVSAGFEPVEHKGQLAPIEHWFFELDRDGYDRWNMSALLKLREGVDLPRLQEALQSAYDRHSALRTPFIASESGWSRGTPVAPGRLIIDQIRLPGTPADLDETAVRDCIAELQASLDIRAGRLVRLAALQFAREDWLVVIVHHLAMDAVSWSILLDEVDYAYTNSQSVPGPASGSVEFATWAALLSESTAAGYFDPEFDYWTGQRWDVAARQVRAVDAHMNVEAASGRVTEAVAAELTERLLVHAGERSDLSVEVLLLAAMTRALSRGLDLDAVLIGMESYGRHDLGSGVDLSSVIGWFTAAYPLLADLDGCGDLAADLKRIKHARQSVPNNGVGFGALKYLHPDDTVRARMATVPEPHFGFNYFGRLDPGAESSVFTGFEGPLPFGRPPQATRPYALELIAEHRGPGLLFRWDFSPNIYDANEVSALAKATTAELRAIADLLDSDSTFLTPSDFPLAGLDQSELDDLLGDE